MKYKEFEKKVQNFQGEGEYSVMLDEFFGYGCCIQCFKSLNKGMAKVISNYLNSIAPDNQLYSVMTDEEASRRLI